MYYMYCLCCECRRVPCIDEYRRLDVERTARCDCIDCRLQIVHRSTQSHQAPRPNIIRMLCILGTKLSTNLQSEITSRTARIGV